MRFVVYPPKPWATVLDQASKLAVEFVRSLVQYEPSRRMTANEVRSYVQPSVPQNKGLMRGTGS